jgi:hypothetical protein
VSPTAGTIIDTSVLLDVFTHDATSLAWSQARLVEAGWWSSTSDPAGFPDRSARRCDATPLLTRDSSRVASYIPGANIIAP